MKEKTFEELIREKFPNWKGDYHIPVFSAIDIITIANKVREATKAECRDIALQDDIIIVGDITTRIENLPTDRIKTEK